MAANYDYIPAIDIIYIDDTWRLQNYDITKPFYEQSIIDLTQNSYSLNILGYMYAKGYGVKTNYSKAIELYKLAITKGNNISHINLGRMYQFGTGVKVDSDKALQLYKIALQGGQILVFNNIIDLFLNHTFEKKDCDWIISIFKTMYKNGTIKLTNDICKLLRYSYFNDIRLEIINFFVEIKQEHMLRNIYNYDSDTIICIRRVNELETKVLALESEISDLKTHIAAMPDGQLYFDAKKEWDNLK